MKPWVIGVLSVHAAEFCGSAPGRVIPRVLGQNKFIYAGVSIWALRGPSNSRLYGRLSRVG